MIRVERISAARLRLDGQGWAFAEAERPAIDVYWRRITAERPHLWNGKVLICQNAAVERGEFVASLAVTDYASFVAWRDWGHPDPQAANCFGVPAVMTSDGALLMGVMGQRTLNGGKLYPPSGTLELRDVTAAGEIDIRGSMVTELREETGLDLAMAAEGETMVIFDHRRIAVVQRHDLPLPFAEVERIFAAHQAAEADPELAGIEAIRSRSQIDSRMPPYAQEIARQFLP